MTQQRPVKINTCNMENDIRDFHEKFDLDYNGEPRMLPKELAQFRIRFLKEELDEYIEAVATGDMAKAFDALLDLTYVAMGTSYLHGFPWSDGWIAVHTANMAKIRAERALDSKRGSTFDVVKPRGWLPPDIASILQRVRK